RPYGPLALPASPSGLPAARANYLRDGTEPDSFSADGFQMKTTEAEPAATPTTAVPSDSDSISNPAAPAGPQQLKFAGNIGAPVDLWDTDWPTGGYYWTVVGVAAVSPGALTTATATVSSIGASSTTAVNAAGFSTGDSVLIGNTSNQESATIIGVNGTMLTF